MNIIEECSFSVNRGEIVSILGPNGAGKSTAMKAMLGILDLKNGNVVLDGKDITKLKTQDRIKLVYPLCLKLTIFYRINSKREQRWVLF